MVFRFSLLLVFACVFSLNEGFAGPGHNKENEPPTQNQSTTPALKRKRITPEKNTSPIKGQKVYDHEITPVFSPLVKYSPITAERKFLSPIRRLFLKQLLDEETVDSPKIRANYRREAPNGYYTRKIVFEGETVLQGDFLFDPYAKVLNSKGKWKTNLNRMKEGLAPVGHKGIIKENERSSLTKKEALSRQRAFTIDIHHVTQNATKTPDNPFCELTHSGHMGHNARFVWETDPETQEVKIIGTSLEKSEALELVDEDPHRAMYCNFLHPLTVPSKINRKLFEGWRKRYWMNRAKEIEEGNFISHPPLFVPKVLFFEPEESPPATSPTLAV